LRRLGFLEYVQGIKPKSNSRLFPLVVSADEKHTKNFGKWWGRYSRLYVPDMKKSFHSFRHTFKNVARNAGIEATLRDALMGHAAKDVAERYGRDEHGLGFGLSTLAQAMEKIQFKGVDFSRVV
jgi:integrase